MSNTINVGEALEMSAASGVPPPAPAEAVESPREVARDVSELVQADSSISEEVDFAAILDQEGGETADSQEEDGPDTVDLAALMSPRDDGRFEMKLWSTACLSCTALTEDTVPAGYDCHASNGNKACPAGYVQLTFVGTRVRIVNKYRKLFKKNPTGIGRMRVMQDLLDTLQKKNNDKLSEQVFSDLGLNPKTED